MNPFFSIIIPAFNSSKTIESCLKSIICQKFEHFEILIIDGLSNDNTINIIKGFNDKRIKIISEKDEGIYDAMNKGIKVSCGDWVYFLGSDDHFHDPYVLKDVYDIEKQNYKVLYGNVKIKGNTSWALDGEIFDGEFDTKKLLSRNICHQSIFYRRGFINSVGFYNPKYRLCADWDYNLRCWAQAKFLYIDRTIANFNAGGESTKNNVDILFWNDFLINIMNYFELSLFDPLLNTNVFPQYNKVRKLQKKTFLFKYCSNEIKKYLRLIIK